MSKKIIYVDTSENISDAAYKEFLKNGFDLSYGGDDGEHAIERILSVKPEIIVVNMFLKRTDGCGVMRTVKRTLPNLKIVAIGSANEQIIDRAISSGADYYLVKPFSQEILLERVRELVGREESAQTAFVATKKPNVSVEEKISEIFISIGIPPHIKGYGYLREGIKTTVENPKIINSVTKQLYPSIAEKFETTPSKVERAIRHAIEVAWNRGRIDAINAIFGARIYLGSEKPTNSEFIALVADKIMLEKMM